MRVHTLFVSDNDCQQTFSQGGGYSRSSRPWISKLHETVMAELVQPPRETQLVPTETERKITHDKQPSLNNFPTSTIMDATGF